MRNKLLSLADKLLLRKRALIETSNDQLNNICQIEQTRHRSVINHGPSPGCTGGLYASAEENSPLTCLKISLNC